MATRTGEMTRTSVRHPPATTHYQRVSQTETLCYISQVASLSSPLEVTEAYRTQSGLSRWGEISIVCCVNQCIVKCDCFSNSHVRSWSNQNISGDCLHGNLVKFPRLYEKLALLVCSSWCSNLGILPIIPKEPLTINRQRDQFGTELLNIFLTVQWLANPQTKSSPPPAPHN